MALTYRELGGNYPIGRRSSSRGVSSSTGSSAGAGVIEVSGAEEVSKMFDHLLTSDPTMDTHLRKLIRVVLKDARNRLSENAKSVMKTDPRRAYRAVKFAVYKGLFGGNVSILQKRKAGAETSYEKPRTLRPGQRGGNRHPRNPRLLNRDKYGGADRGFILRFLNAGTEERRTRFGNRGSIRTTEWFGHTAPWQMEQAAQELADNINEYIKQTANNG